MNLPTIDRPSRGPRLLELLDHPDDLREYMEEQLVGPDFLRLVRDLEQFHGISTEADELASALRARILVRGFVGLTGEEFGKLMRQPRLLLMLQNAVLLEGSDYWDRVVRRSQGGQSPLENERTPTALLEVTKPDPPMPFRERDAMPRRSAILLAALVGMASAAAVLLMVWSPLMRLTDVERRYQSQVARSQHLEQELIVALQSRSPVVEPADLPEAGSFIFFKDPDDLPLDDVVPVGLDNPADLPDEDPRDLPEKKDPSNLPI